MGFEIPGRKMECLEARRSVETIFVKNPAAARCSTWFVLTHLARKQTCEQSQSSGAGEIHYCFSFLCVLKLARARS